jgi:hypothetical protein
MRLQEVTAPAQVAIVFFSRSSKPGGEFCK